MKKISLFLIALVCSLSVVVPGLADEVQKKYTAGENIDPGIYEVIAKSGKGELNDDEYNIDVVMTPKGNEIQGFVNNYRVVLNEGENITATNCNVKFKKISSKKKYGLHKIKTGNVSCRNRY